MSPHVVVLTCLHIFLISASWQTSFFVLFFDFSLTPNSSYSPPPHAGAADTLAVNAHRLTRRRLQLTIVGFHHHCNCSASRWWPVREYSSLHYRFFCFSFMPSFSHPSCLLWWLWPFVLSDSFSPLSPTCASVCIYIHSDEANVNTGWTFGVKITFSSYQL